MKGAYWEIEAFKALKYENGQFVYATQFKRFPDTYSICSTNIPNESLKEDFRKKWLEKNPTLKMKAESQKRAKSAKPKNAVDAIVISEKEASEAEEEAGAEKQQ